MTTFLLYLFAYQALNLSFFMSRMIDKDFNDPKVTRLTKETREEYGDFKTKVLYVTTASLLSIPMGIYAKIKGE